MFIMYAFHIQVFGADPGFFYSLYLGHASPRSRPSLVNKKFPLYDTYLAFLGDLPSNALLQRYDTQYIKTTQNKKN